jgi:hypothetical protein
MSDTSLQQFPVGQQRTITATVTKDGQPFTDTLSWSASSGTLTPAADTLSATLDNAAAGTVTVTATDSAGASGEVSFELVDQAQISLTVA